MRKIESTRQFDKDLKNIGLLPELIDVLHALINGLPVPEKYKRPPTTRQLEKVP